MGRVLTWREGLLELVSLLAIWDTESVEVTAATDLEFDSAGSLLDLHGTLRKKRKEGKDWVRRWVEKRDFC